MAMFNDIVIFPGGGGGDYIVSFPGGGGMARGKNYYRTPARLGISDFFTFDFVTFVPSDNRNTRSTCPTSVFTGTGQSDKR